MCPGGIVVPAATGPEQIVVNGMSPSHRNTAWSNSGMVVELRPEDLTLENGKLMLGNTPFDIDMESLGKNINPQGNCQLSIDNSQLKMLAFQAALERLCWMQGNYRQTAPAQRMADFVNGRLGGSLPESSYAPGLIPSPMHFWMPSFVSDRLREGLRYFGKQSHGFLTNEAVVIGVETRTSAPVRILRDKDSLQHVRVQGLFPCGEGAGYAGGIVSAAVDGERCAEAASFYLMENG